jgi:hypothetical protein
MVVNFIFIYEFQRLGSSCSTRQCTLLSRRFLHAESETTIAPIAPAVPDKLYQQIKIELKGHDKAVLKSYSTVLKAAATNLEIPSGDM